MTQYLANIIRDQKTPKTLQNPDVVEYMCDFSWTFWQIVHSSMTFNSAPTSSVILED